MTALTLQFAQEKDIAALMRYIHEEWSPHHIFSRDIDFFRYQYCRNGKVHFVLAKDGDKAIKGMLGYIPASSQENADVWTTMWKVSKNAGSPVLGLQLLEFLKNAGYRNLMSSGINAKTQGIYRFLGYQLGEMAHYYIRNPLLSQTQLAQFPTHPPLGAPVMGPTGQDVEIKALETSDWVADYFSRGAGNQVPHKDFAYFKWRFFDHPIYNYEVFGLYLAHQLTALFVTRTVQAQGASALRLVDYYGNSKHLGLIGQFLTDKIQAEHHEYADMLCAGLPSHDLDNTAFIRLDPDQKDIIVPNYFSPFLKENVRICFFSSHPIENGTVFFKADGDQDRPS